MVKPTPEAATPEVKSVDLADLNTATASDAGAEVELRHPVTDAPLGIFIRVLGKHSEVFRSHVRDSVNERLRRSAVAERSGKPLPVPTAEETEQRAVELLVLCTLGWRSEVGKPGTPEHVKKETITHKGEELRFSVQNASTLYSEIIWLREQVDRGIGDLELFIKA